MFNGVKGLKRRGQRMNLLDTGITVVNDSVKGIRKHTKPMSLEVFTYG